MGMQSTSGSAEQAPRVRPAPRCTKSPTWQRLLLDSSRAGGDLGHAKQAAHCAGQQPGHGGRGERFNRRALRSVPEAQPSPRRQEHPLQRSSPSRTQARTRGGLLTGTAATRGPGSPLSRCSAEEGSAELPKGCQNQINACNFWQQSSERERTPRQCFHDYKGII